MAALQTVKNVLFGSNLNSILASFNKAKEQLANHITLCDQQMDVNTDQIAVLREANDDLESQIGTALRAHNALCELTGDTNSLYEVDERD